jgi:hypothetical protein
MLCMTMDTGRPLLITVTPAIDGHQGEVRVRGGGGLDRGTLVLAVPAPATLDIPEGLLQM